MKSSFLPFLPPPSLPLRPLPGPPLLAGDQLRLILSLDGDLSRGERSLGGDGGRPRGDLSRGDRRGDLRTSRWGGDLSRGGGGDRSRARTGTGETRLSLGGDRSRAVGGDLLTGFSLSRCSLSGSRGDFLGLSSRVLSGDFFLGGAGLTSSGNEYIIDGVIRFGSLL